MTSVHDNVNYRFLEDNLAALLKKADNIARGMVRRYSRPLADRDDLRNDLLLDLINRIPKYKPKRGSFITFANVIFANHSRYLARRYYQEEALFNPPPHEWEPNEPERDVDELESLDRTVEAEFRLWLESALERLTAPQRVILSVLSKHSPSSATTVIGLSRGTIHRYRRDIRMRLQMQGAAA